MGGLTSDYNLCYFYSDLITHNQINVKKRIIQVFNSYIFFVRINLLFHGYLFVEIESMYNLFWKRKEGDGVLTIQYYYEQLQPVRVEQAYPAGIPTLLPTISTLFFIV